MPDDHDAPHPDVGQIIQHRQDCFVILRQEPCLLGLPCNVYLQQHIHDLSLFRRFFFQRTQQVLTVRGLDQIKRLHSLLCLIGLQVSD